MHIYGKKHIQWIGLLVILLTFTSFLAACGDSGTSAKGNIAPTPTATLYQGDGYTVSYSADWQVSKQGEIAQFSLVNGDQTVSVSINGGPAEVTTPGGTIKQEKALDFMFVMAEQTLILQNYQSDNSLATTTTLAGDTWRQAGGTYDDHGTTIKGVVLGDLHKAGAGHIITIILKAKASNYNQVYSTLFKPLLDTFRFV